MSGTRAGGGETLAVWHGGSASPRLKPSEASEGLFLRAAKRQFQRPIINSLTSPPNSHALDVVLLRICSAQFEETCYHDVRPSLVPSPLSINQANITTPGSSPPCACAGQSTPRTPSSCGGSSTRTHSSSTTQTPHIRTRFTTPTTTQLASPTRPSTSPLS